MFVIVKEKIVLRARLRLSLKIDIGYKFIVIGLFSCINDANLLRGQLKKVELKAYWHNVVQYSGVILSVLILSNE